MKAKEVLEKLNITRPTLTKYVKQGLIKTDSVVNGQYIYNDESVYALLNGKGTHTLKDGNEDESTKEELTKLIRDTANIFAYLIQLRVLPPVINDKVECINTRCNKILNKQN